MASRLWQAGTQYTRTCNGIKLGLINSKQRPVWLEAYYHTPPLDNPVYNSQDIFVQDVRFMTDDLESQKIIYEEDKHRAIFQEYFGNGGQIYNFNERITGGDLKRKTRKFKEVVREGANSTSSAEMAGHEVVKNSLIKKFERDEKSKISPKSFKALPVHPVEKLANQIRKQHHHINSRKYKLKHNIPIDTYLTVENLQAVKQRVLDNAPEDEPKSNFIQSLDKKDSMQPKPVGRMFGNVYGADIKDWPMY